MVYCKDEKKPMHNTAEQVQFNWKHTNDRVHSCTRINKLMIYFTLKVFIKCATERLFSKRGTFIMSEWGAPKIPKSQS